MQNHLQLELHLRRAWDGRIGALVADRDEGGRWAVDALGAPHVGADRVLCRPHCRAIADSSPSTFLFFDTGRWSTEFRHRALPPVHISTAIPRMRSICATCSPRSAPRRRRHCTSYAELWACLESRTG